MATKTDAEAAVIEDDGDWVTTEAQLADTERFTTVEGTDVMGFNFDDGNVGSFVTYTNGGDMDLSVQDGELVCDIKSTGHVEHGCQVYYDGFTMAKGCVYTMQFDIRSDIERTVQWRIQINGGDYHMYAGDYVTLGPETQTVTCEFTMEEDSDPAPRFVINMGQMEGDGDLAEHNIYVDNISLFVTDSSNAEVIEGAPVPIQVKVNQLGYLPDDEKRVVVTSADDTKFKIVKADTEETVYVGEYGELKFDKAVQFQIKSGDFSDFTTPGTYKIISSPSGASYEFTIGDGIYDDVYKDLVLMLYKQRCGTELDESIAGAFAHSACHTGEAVVYGSESSSTVDVSGGWHDAGDYGRYVVPGAKAVQDLMLAYEDYNYTADDIGIPESGNGVPDLLDEARYELEWMLKMQDGESGGVYHKVTCAVFPEIVMPEDETDQLILAPISYTATCDFAAVMSKASVIYAEYDGDFAESCLEAAKKAYEFAAANADMRAYANPDEISTGSYSDNTTKDETMWAAAELYLATGDDTYKSALEETMTGTLMAGLGWADIGGFALYDLAKSDAVDESIKTAAKDRLIQAADEHIEACQKEVFGTGLGDDYSWGSNMTVANNIQLLLMANRLSPNEDYIRYAKINRDYIFGINPVGYCYVTGYGSNSPEHTHHRPSQYLGETMPGMLVGGANAGFNDPYSKAVLTGSAAGLAYVDNEQSYSCNEITIYWNSPLIYAMTGLMSE
jgi:endoglucanase